MARTVGERPIQPLAVLALVGGIILTGVITSWTVGSKLGFAALLGHPMFGFLYVPWAWVTWLWMAYNPFTGVDLLTHQHHYTPLVYAALATIPWTMSFGIAASVVVYAVITARLAPKEDEIKNIVD